MDQIHRGFRPPPDPPGLGWAQSGEGPDVILVHGAITTLDDMVLSLFPTLSPRLRVTAFDRPGHGASAHLGPTGSPWRQARAVREAALGLGLRRPVVLGHSYGTAVAMAYALQFPREIAGVVLLSPIAFPEIRLEHFLFAPRGLPGPWQIVNRLLCATLDPLLLPLLWNAMFLPQAMPEAYAHRFPFADAFGAEPMRAEGEDALGLNIGLAWSALLYPLCAAPVEILVGAQDKVVTPLQAVALSRLLPEARLSVLPNLGHMLHHFAPADVEAAVHRTMRRGESLAGDQLDRLGPVPGNEARGLTADPDPFDLDR